jgi:hypothetical protein
MSMKDAYIALCVDNKGIKTVVRADYGLLDPGDMVETDVGSVVLVTKVVFDPDGEFFCFLEQVVTVRNAIKVWRKHWEAEGYMHGD